MITKKLYINVRLFIKKRIYVLYIYQINLELGKNFLDYNTYKTK